MKHFIPIILFYSILCPANETKILEIGTFENIPISEASDLKVSDSKVIKIQKNGPNISIYGKALGSAKIQFNKKTIDLLVVTPQELIPTLSLIDRIKMNKSLSFTISEGKISIFGRMDSTASWLSLANARCPNWRLNVMVDNPLQIQIKKILSTQLKKLGLSGLTLEFGSPIKAIIGDTLQQESESWKALLNQYGIEYVISKNVIQPIPTIKHKMWLTEIRKESLSAYGINLPNQFSKSKFDPETVIQFLESNGNGKVLANPTLVSRSGEPAEFFAGGEFPIKIFNFKTQDVVWKQYGIRMKTKSSVDSYGRVRMDFETEVSSIDGSRAIDGIPAMFTTKVSSHFDLLEEKSILISGLIKQINSETAKGFPWLKDLPILGALFQSQDFVNDRSEMVIFVKPEVVYE